MKLRITALLASGLLIVVMVSSMAAGKDPEELTAPEKGLLLIEQEIEDFQSDGMPDDHPIMERLLEKRDRYKELAAGPPPEEPDPEAVAEILSRERTSKPEWMVGLVSCEGGVGTPKIPEGVTVRCVSVPQDDTNNIEAWLMSNGTAWVYYHVFGGGGGSAWVKIPEWPNIKDAQYEVEGEELRVVYEDETFIFDTDEWSEEAKLNPDSAE